MSTAAQRRNVRTRTRTQRNNEAPLGRPSKFGSPVAQSSIHLKQEQKAWIRSHAAQRAKQLGVDVSLSDVVRWAVDFYREAHDATNARGHERMLSTAEANESIARAQHERKEGKLGKD